MPTLDDDDMADTQRELQQYLQSHAIDALFARLVEELLLERPTNPVGFIAQYLLSHYPVECAGITSHAADARGADESDEDDSGSEDDTGEDYADEVSAVALRRTQERTRRANVFSETVDPHEFKTEEPMRVEPKAPEEAARIMTYLAQTTLFSHLPKSHHSQVADAMFLSTFEAGESIIKQGDSGNYFYIVDEGTCSIFKATEDGKQELVKQCERGGSFGELALLYNAPRAATVVAASRTALWTLDRKTFKRIVIEGSIKTTEVNKGFLDRVPILESLTDDERRIVADALLPDEFKPGDEIIRQNDVGGMFYIIEEGEVVCTKQVGDKPPREVMRLSNGMYFGEIALLTDRPRQATVVATTPVKCLCLDRKTFKRVMGPLTDILKRNMAAYNMYMSQKI